MLKTLMIFPQVCNTLNSIIGRVFHIFHRWLLCENPCHVHHLLIGLHWFLLFCLNFFFKLDKYLFLVFLVSYLVVKSLIFIFFSSFFWPNFFLDRLLGFLHSRLFFLFFFFFFVPNFCLDHPFGFSA